MQQQNFDRNLRITKWLIAAAFVLPGLSIVLGFDIAEYRLHHQFYTEGHLVNPDAWHATYSPIVSKVIKVLFVCTAAGLIYFSSTLKNTAARATARFALVLGIIGAVMSWLNLNS